MSMIYNIFEQLANDNSRLAKEAILVKNKDNKTLKQVFYLALDPFIQFYIRKIPSYDFVSENKVIFLCTYLKTVLMSQKTLTNKNKF